MFRNGVAMLVALMMFVMAPSDAAAQDVSAALERIDEIIAEMQTMRAEVAALAAASKPAPVVLGASTSGALTEDLSFGETNDDIARIQRLLATDPTIYNHPHITGFFGPKTQEGVRNFQLRFGLDPVGVIGPATTALLEVFLNAYPNENYPAGVLDKKPTATVLGASTSTPAPAVTTTPKPEPTKTPVTTSSGAARSIEVEVGKSEADAKIIFKNGSSKFLSLGTDDEDEIIDEIVDRTSLKEADVRAVINFGKLVDEAAEEKAEDALDDAEDAIEDAELEIEEADDDEEDVDWAEDTLEEAEEKLEAAEDALDDGDYDDAIELAEEAEDLADDAADRIGRSSDGEQGDSDEIEKIEVTIEDEDEAEVVVEYEDDDDYEFTVSEDQTDDLLEAIADDLNVDEEDIEDLIEYDYGEIVEIEVDVDLDKDEAKVVVLYESDVERKFTIDADDDEDEMIEDIAEEVDEKESLVEDLTDFDY